LTKICPQAPAFPETPEFFSEAPGSYPRFKIPFLRDLVKKTLNKYKLGFHSSEKSNMVLLLF